MAEDLSQYKGRKFGRVLTKMGKVTREQVYEGLALQKKRKIKLGDALVELGHIKSSVIVKALADPDTRRMGRFVIYGLNELLTYAADMHECNPFWFRTGHRHHPW